MIVLVKVTFYLDSYLSKSLAVFPTKLLTFFVTFLITQPCTEFYFSKLREKKKGKKIPLPIKLKHSGKVSVCTWQLFGNSFSQEKGKR